MLEKNENVVVIPMGGDLYVKSQNKVGLGTIVYSEMMLMLKKLRIYMFFEDF